MVSAAYVLHKFTKMREDKLTGGFLKLKANYRRPENGRVDNVWPVGGANDEYILLAAHSVHLGQNLNTRETLLN